MTDAAARISAWARTEPRLGLAAVAAPRVERLGAGESYTAWRVEDDLVVRVARRPLLELPRPMGAQLAALQLVPDGLGPRAVLVEESPEPLGAPFVVTGYVPGVERPAQDWTDELLAAHARGLARLHARAFGRCGDLLTPEGSRSRRYSLVERHEGALAWWREHHPELFEVPEVRALLPSVAAFVAAAEPAFARLDRFALVHGDLVLTNVVVDTGVPRYIDWEWAEIGDPVADLALLGGPVATAPWYLPLPGDRLEFFLDAYVDTAEGRAGPPAELRRRRDAYEVHERFVSSLYYRSLPRHQDAARAVTDGLAARLG